MVNYILQSNFGNKGNFEVLIRLGDKLQHWWRNNDATNVDTAWIQGNQGNPVVGNLAGSPALIQSSFGNKRNFEVVIPVHSGNVGALQHWWRNNDATNVDTAWIQGNQGNPIVTGNFG
jgi:hypothetical protein